MIEENNDIVKGAESQDNELNDIVEESVVESEKSQIAEDFDWVTSNMDRAATLSWTSTTSFRINGEPETFYENAEVISGTHPVLDDQGKQNLVLGIARLRDSKIYRYDHMRKLSG